jgi:hypothetical protein
MNYTDAKDFIFATFVAAWNLGAQSIVGGTYLPRVYFVGVGPYGPRDNSQVWCRISMQTVNEPQSALGSNVGTEGNRRYTVDGLVFVQIFCPKLIVNGQNICDRLAVLAKNSFRRGSTGEVIFSNARIQELDPEEQYLRINVVSEYEYDETA